MAKSARTRNKEKIAAASASLWVAWKAQDIPLARKAMRAGAEMTRTWKGEAVINLATHNFEFLKALLEEGADPNEKGILVCALQKYNDGAEMVRMLVEYGADVNRANSELPLVIAIHPDRSSMIELLLELGADPNLRGIKGISALEQAEKIHQGLRDDPKPWLDAPEVWDPIIAMLKKRKTKLRDANIWKDTPKSERAFAFTTLARYGRDRWVREFLKRGVSPDPTYNKARAAPYPAVWNAASSGHVSTLKILLNAKASVNKKGGVGTTPIHEAAIRNDLEIIQLLLKHGADPSIMSSAGETPYEIAKRLKHHDAAAAVKPK